MFFGKHNISTSTPSNVLFGAGTYYFGLTWDSATKKWNGNPFGATNGGGKLTIKGEFVDLELDGALVKFKGQTVKQGGTAAMEISIAEYNETVLRILTLFQRGVSDVAEYDLLSDKPFIEFGDYLENVAFVGKTADNSRDIIVIFESALCTSGLETDPQDKEQSVLKATIEAYAKNIGELDTLPVKIYYLNDEPEVTSAMYLYGTPAPTVVTYNGVELPDIETVWTDKETYPYAYVQDCTSLSSIGTYLLYLTDGAAERRLGYVGGEGYCVSPATTRKKYQLIDGVWTFNGDGTGEVSVGENGYLCIWGSADILDSKDSSIVYLAASDPVYTQTGGNIGLRSGDTVTLYEGIVATDINGVYTDELKETHPYAAIVQNANLNTIRLECNAEPFTAYADGGISVLNNDIKFVYKDGVWQQITSGGSGYVALWSNYDIVVDGSTVCAATAPIPVSGLVGYSYNGIVSPDVNTIYTDELQETHPYAAIYRHASGAIVFTAEARKENVSAEGTALIMGSDRVHELVDGAWEYRGTGNIGFTPIWANHDIYYGDGVEVVGGTLYLSASDPVPVYE